MSRTYVMLEISEGAYNEIAGYLRAAGYNHVFGDEGEIDMHGIALITATPVAKDPVDAYNAAMGIIS